MPKIAKSGAKKTRRRRRGGSRMKGLNVQQVSSGVCLVHCDPDRIRRAMRFYRDVEKHFKK